MSDWREKRKVLHATRLLEGINELKIGGEMTDFIVKVGTTAFPVHRLVLAVSSPYFRAMLSHTMKEAVEGNVDMKGLSANAVGTCIQFMYAGEVDLTMTGVADVLYAASFMQLDPLLAVCSDFLDENIDTNTAISTKELAMAYDFEDLERKSRKYIMCNLDKVSSTTAFFDLSVDGVAEYTITEDSDKKVAWTAVMNWLRFDKDRRSKHLADLFQKFSAHDNSVESIISLTWGNEEVQMSHECQLNLQRRLMALTANEIILISKDICCQVKRILRNCEIGDTLEINEAMQELLQHNFEEISKMEAFKSLTYADLAQALQKSECPDNIKWDAILNWIKHDKNRRKRFPELLRYLNLSALSAEFIQVNVRQEEVVNESTESMMMLMDALAAKLRTSNDAKKVLNCTPIPSPTNSPPFVRNAVVAESDVAEIAANENDDVAASGEEGVANQVNPGIQQPARYSLTPEEISSFLEGEEEDNSYFNFSVGQHSSTGSAYPHEIAWCDEESNETTNPRCSESNPHHIPTFNIHRYSSSFRSLPVHPPPPPLSGLHLHRPRHHHRHPPPPPPHHHHRHPPPPHHHTRHLSPPFGYNRSGKRRGRPM